MPSGDLRFATAKHRRCVSSSAFVQRGGMTISLVYQTVIRSRGSADSVPFAQRRGGPRKHMRLINARRLSISLLAVLLSAPLSAQTVRPLALEDIEGLLKNRVPAARILSRARERCIGFVIDSDADARMKRAGGGAIFIDQLREVCNPNMPKGSEAGGSVSAPVVPPVQIAAAADSVVAVRVTAALVGADLTVTKLPQLELLVIGPQGDSTRLSTDLNGEANGSLRPGMYRFESAADVRGSRYRWGIYVPVQAGMRPVELTQKNAAVEGVTSSSPASTGPTVFAPPGTVPVPTASTDAQPVGAEPQPVAPAAGAPPRSRRVSEEAVLFDKYKSGVFTVYGSEGRGSGFLIDSSGLVLTNAHTVRLGGDVRVLIDSATKIRARVIAINTEMDVAVLGISRTRCGKCVVLPLFDTTRGPLANAGERVVAMGSPMNPTSKLAIGIVNNADAQAVVSDVSINYLNSGGPLVNLDGDVVAVNVFRDEARPGQPKISSSLPITRILSVLSAARDSVTSLAMNPPSDSLLPVPPRDAFPSEPIVAVARTAELDIKKYRQEVNDFRLFVMTPQILAWRQAQAAAKLADMRKRGDAKGIVNDQIDPIQLWTDWNDYLVTRKALVVFNVTPSATEYPFYDVDKVVEASGGSVADMKIYRDGRELTPVEKIRVPATLTGSARRAAGREIPYQGVFSYRAEDFGPKPDGTPASFSVTVWDASKTGAKTESVPLDKRIVEVILRDFSPYFIGMRGR